VLSRIGPLRTKESLLQVVQLVLRAASLLQLVQLVLRAAATVAMGLWVRLGSLCLARMISNRNRELRVEVGLGLTFMTSIAAQLGEPPFPRFWNTAFLAPLRR
jgi:hypothetical protein